METLFSRYHALNIALNAHVCHILNIPDAALGSYFPETTEFNSAIWHYLPVTSVIRAAAQNGFAQGMHEHRDPSTFVTCLIQSRPGLEVQNHAGEWVDVPMIEGAVICNVGEFSRASSTRSCLSMVSSFHRYAADETDRRKARRDYASR